VGEESGVDEEGIKTSPIEWSFKAMKQAGADTKAAEHFIHALQQKGDLEGGLIIAVVPATASDFIRFTFKKFTITKPIY